MLQRGIVTTFLDATSELAHLSHGLKQILDSSAVEWPGPLRSPFQAHRCTGLKAQKLYDRCG